MKNFVLTKSLVLCVLLANNTSSYACTDFDGSVNVACEIGNLTFTPQGVAQEMASCLANGAELSGHGNLLDKTVIVILVPTRGAPQTLEKLCGETWKQLAERWYQLQIDAYGYEEIVLSAVLGGLAPENYYNSPYSSPMCSISSQITIQHKQVRTNVCDSTGCTSRIEFYIDYVPNANWGSCGGA